MVITVSSSKGGSTCSTVALLLAYASKGAAVDLDPQMSLTLGLSASQNTGSSYIGIEEFNLIPQASLALHGGLLVPGDTRLSRLANDPQMRHIKDTICAFDSSHTGVTILDTQGSRDNLTIGAALAGDIVLVPAQLNDTDMHATVRWINVLKSEGLAERIRVVASRVDRRIGDNTEAFAFLESLGVKVLKTIIPQKKVFARAMTDGMSKETTAVANSLLEELV